MQHYAFVVRSSLVASSQSASLIYLAVPLQAFAYLGRKGSYVSDEQHSFFTAAKVRHNGCYLHTLDLVRV